ncbi:MAG TPA: hypothetical protein DIU15_16980, partial [Deltaproteobacteria bacterium]|nr:hypothetical protein [Deltaproteobacteria bacterium]HCP47738.1 hypothetical protein [Deltaproteobacteria bacterium]
NDDNLTLLWEALEAAARDGTYQVSGSRGGVSIVGLRDLHGADVPWLWLGGCVDGEFPRAHRPSFLLPPEAASHISRLDTGDEDRTIFLSLLRNIGHGDQRAEASLFISRPGTVGGKDVSASPLLQDLRALRVEADKPTGTKPPTTAGEVWDLLQAKEEARLPPVLAVPELLVHPEFHADKPELAQFLSPTLRERTTAHNQWCLDLANPTGFGPRDGILALGRDHRAQVIGWLHDGLRVDQHAQRQRLTLPVTGLELWARCPIRFFFSRVLRADEPEEWSPEPSARDEGVLLHRVLERLLQERLQAVTSGELNTASLEGLDHDELAGVKRRAAELVRELAPEVLSIQQGPYRDRVLRLLTAGLDDADHEVASFQGKLASFLEEETTAFLGLEPAHLEWPFAEFEPAARASDLDGCPETATGDLLVQLSGTIDRIDVSRAGSTGLGGARKAAFDYKSGKAPLLARVDEGSYLQPAIYAAAIDTAGPDQGLVGGYLELSMDGTTSRRRLTGDPQVLEALHTEGRANTSFRRTSQPLNRWLLAAWLRRVDLYGQMVGAGIFPPTLAGPVVAGCEHCSFRRACRYDSVRTGRVTAPSGRLGTLLPVPLPVSRFQPENDEETSP